MKRIISTLLAIFVIVTCVGRSNSGDEQLKKENEELKAQIQELQGKSETVTDEEKDTDVSNSKINAKWVHGDTPNIFDTSEMTMEILDDITIAKSSNNDYIIALNFIYTNKRDEGHNFINDKVRTKFYQSGIELDTPGIVSEVKVYDKSNAYKSIKDGATIETQLAYILNDTESAIDVEIRDSLSILATKQIQIETIK